MKTQIATDTSLSILAQELKEYIKSRGSGITVDELNEILDEKIIEINNEISNADSSIVTNDDIDLLFTNSWMKGGFYGF